MTADLAAMLAKEDRDEQFGRIEADARMTCSEHKTWADRVHMEREH